MRTLILVVTVVAVGPLCGAAGHAAPPDARTTAKVTFSGEPAATRVGDTVKVRFTVSAATDVEVAVLTEQGRVVRHLAAGVLGGPKPPPAPLKPGLSQTLEWDVKNDFGRPAGPGPFRVRVRAGTGVTFGRLIGGDPYTFGSITGVATDEDGTLYVLANGGVLGQRQITLRVFDPQGRYLREIIPFPADLAPEAVAKVARWDAERSAFRPKNYKNLNPDFYPGGHALRLVSASRKGGIVLTSGTNVYRMGLDGGRFVGPLPMWRKEAKLRNPKWNIPQLAVSADGRYVFYANVAGTQYQPKHFNDTDPRWPQGRVYRQDTQQKGDPQPFYNLELPDWEAKRYWLPDAWNKRTAAYGIDVDARGHLYVCDLVNQAIIEVDAQGRKVSSTSVPWPERVHVSPRTGDYYVITRLDRPKDGRVPNKLVKVRGRGAAARIVAEMPLRRSLGVTSALGTVKGRPVLWLGGGGSLVCVRDAGETFEIIETAFKRNPDVQPDWNRIAVDYERDEVYVNNGASLMWRYDGKTGAGGMLTLGNRPFYATDLAVGYDGLLYVRRGRGYPLGQDYSGPFERYTRDLQPAPYSETATHVLSKYIYSRYGIGYAERGIGVAPDGTVYISWMYQGWVTYAITGFGPDGRPLQGKYLRGKCHADNYKQGTPKALNSAVIGPVTASNGGIRVDLDGNIYVGLWLWPKGHPRPKGVENDRAYLHSTGSIVKFTPEGGRMAVTSKNWGSDFMDIIPPTPGATGLAMQSGGRPREAFVQGALAAYPGLGPFSHTGFGGNTCCVCRVPRFDIDRYGRLVMPNAITNSVRLLDNAGNAILEFGAYGNFDSRYVNLTAERGRQGTPTVAVPAIPLAWPTGAGLSAGHIYVNDTYNRRVVRVDKTYAAEAVCAVR